MCGIFGVEVGFDWIFLGGGRFGVELFVVGNYEL